MCLCVHVSVVGWTSEEADSDGKITCMGIIRECSRSQHLWGKGRKQCATGAREGSSVQRRDKRPFRHDRAHAQASVHEGGIPLHGCLGLGHLRLVFRAPHWLQTVPRAGGFGPSCCSFPFHLVIIPIMASFTQT